MKLMNRKLRTPALSQSIRKYIKDYIVEHQLQAGDPLPSEGHFAEEFGVSRSPVREAVKALQSLGIIEVRHGEGLFVREWNLEPFLETLTYGLRFNPQTLAELYQIRVWLEMAVIEDVAMQISVTEIGELELLMLHWKHAYDNNQPYLKFDRQFHQIILRVMKNDTLLKLFDAFWVAFENYDNVDLLMARDPLRVIKEHQEVVDAIKLHDSDLARQKLRHQFIGFSDRIERLAADNSEVESLIK